jgi:hypothetical protein
MDTPMLRPDCDRCAALCCVGLAFDRSPRFALAKRAGQPCPHLGRHGCRIHREREQRGFGGCVDYDCLGAGQRVTQELFGGRSWRDDPALLTPMLDAFLALREVHEHLALLATATTLPLTPAQARERDHLREALAGAWSVDQLRPRLRAFYARLALKAEAPG